MNVNDRFALELGRALVRALVAEAEAERLRAENEKLTLASLEVAAQDDETRVPE